MSYVRFKIKKMPLFFGVFCSLHECKEISVFFSRVDKLHAYVDCFLGHVALSILSCHGQFEGLWAQS